MAGPQAGRVLPGCAARVSRSAWVASSAVTWGLFAGARRPDKVPYSQSSGSTVGTCTRWICAYLLRRDAAILVRYAAMLLR